MEKLSIALHGPMPASPAGRYVAIRVKNLANRFYRSFPYIAATFPYGH
jgi:hypothetical protein